MDACCPSDFSRQRAVVVTNTPPVMIEAVITALESSESTWSATELERVLVQLDQLARRPALGGELRTSLLHVVDDARRALAADDSEGALEDLRGAASLLSPFRL